jgi:hypothetical protein
MTAQQAGAWSRREFLRSLALVVAAGVAGMYSRSGTAVEAQPKRRPTDTPSGTDMCPKRAANAYEICPNCCHYRDESM